ncbi:MAG: restriction endonuclease [Proteobacteria bacterium]|nr:restriction endonuclease [Pseudomonadota bacterium]MBU1397636.1 restriction endonuclease [Pseudomonadota bacterium]
MPDYDFRNLSPIDFEILVRDLIQEELGVRLESFKAGRDQGIDFRYCPSKDEKIIVQAKRYVDTDYRTFFRGLKHDEVPKVQRLSPSRYILATSLGLTPLQKDELLKLYHPFIITSGDILGRDDINGLLSRHSKVERQHFKLWMTSTTVLEQILNSKILNASRDELEKIQDHAKYYVQNESFGKGLKILDEHNICIIAGTPGIGKTILAEMLALHFVNLGYQVVKVTEDISEAAGFDYVNQRRLFYYDDFLGQTSLSEKLNKNEDQRLLDFIQALRRSKVSKLILTTREYILNRARMMYEKLQSARFNLQTFIIDLSFYTRKIRTQILYNHMYFSELSDSFKQAVLADEGYIRIIDHPNYNPRIVQFMTDPLRNANVSPENYWTIFRRNLDNPQDIWKHAFEEQLSRASKNLLLLLFTLPQEVFMEDIEKAFESYHKKQAQEHGYETNGADFEHALKELESSFVSSSKSRDRILLQLVNPSLKDFLASFIVDNHKYLSDLIDSSVFHEQLTWLWEFYRSNIARMGHSLRAEDVTVKIGDRVGITMQGPSCRTVNYKDQDDKSSYKGAWCSSFEEKALLPADMLALSRNQVTINVFEQVVITLKERIQNKVADREDLIKFLRKVNSSGLINAEKDEFLIKLVKEYLMSDLDFISKYRALVDFRELFLDVICEEETTAVKASFLQFASELDSYWSDPDFIRGDADDLRSIGDRLSIDVSHDVERLEARAAEIEKESAPDEDDRDYSGDGGESDYYSDDDIRSMFATLRC